MTQARALEVRDLVKRYPNGLEALKCVSLDLGAGAFFGLLGPNGAGKSTMIHCSPGWRVPTSGTISIFGNDAVDHYREARESVGLAPQEINLDMFLTSRRRSTSTAGTSGCSKADRRERSRELLDAFSLTGKRDERPGRSQAA